MLPGDAPETPRREPASEAIQPAIVVPLRRPLSAEDLTLLNEEIAGMARAGLPLDQGLRALAGEMGHGRLQRVTAELADDLRAGYTLPEALERRGSQTPPFYAALVGAGIRTGRIGDVLSTLTTYARTVAEVRSTIVSALLYPLVIVVAALFLFILAFNFILPPFEAIFKDFGLQLPLLTLFVLSLGHNWLYVVIGLGVFVSLVLILRAVLNSTMTGRCIWAYFIYAIPIVGTLIRAARLAAFTELLGILVDHEVPLPEAFRLAGEASSDPITAAAAGGMEQDLRQGRPLGEVVRNRRFTRELIVWMIGLGERRGTLGKTLHQIAQVYRRQVEMRAAILRSVLPPFLVIVTAAFLVVFFVAGTMLPMFRLLEGLSGF